METEELKELFRKHNIGFEDICRFWITTYPEDIFSEKNPVGKITKLMKDILKDIEENQKKLTNLIKEITEENPECVTNLETALEKIKEIKERGNE